MAAIPKIDKCCLQEIDIQPDFNHDLLTFKGDSLQVESNGTKARAGVYVRNGSELMYSFMFNYQQYWAHF